MFSTNTTQQDPPPMVFWVIWASIFCGLLVMQEFIGGGFPTGEDAGGLPYETMLPCLGGVGVATLLRWFVLPRRKSLQTKLTMMIIGLAMAEGTGLMGMFLIGEEFVTARQFVLICSLVGIVQFLPVYASKGS